MERGCGVLLPVSAIPNNYGFGCLSKEAYDFVDQLVSAGQQYCGLEAVGSVLSEGRRHPSACQGRPPHHLAGRGREGGPPADPRGGLRLQERRGAHDACT